MTKQIGFANNLIMSGNFFLHLPSLVWKQQLNNQICLYRSFASRKAHFRGSEQPYLSRILFLIFFQGAKVLRSSLFSISLKKSDPILKSYFMSITWKCLLPHTYSKLGTCYFKQGNHDSLKQLHSASLHLLFIYWLPVTCLESDTFQRVCTQECRY